MHAFPPQNICIYMAAKWLKPREVGENTHYRCVTAAAQLVEYNCIFINFSMSCAIVAMFNYIVMTPPKKMEKLVREVRCLDMFKVHSLGER